MRVRLATGIVCYSGCNQGDWQAPNSRTIRSYCNSSVATPADPYNTLKYDKNGKNMTVFQFVLRVLHMLPLLLLVLIVINWCVMSLLADTYVYTCYELSH